MKKFFAKAAKPFAINTDLANELSKKGSSSKNDHSSKASTSKPSSAIPHANVGLQPKYMLPAVPHPCPYDHLAILAVKEGLLIRPHIRGQSRNSNTAGSPSSYLKILWRTSEVVEVQEKAESHPDKSTATQSEIDDWQEAAVVYGIVGILELFSCATFLLIENLTCSAEWYPKVLIFLSSVPERKWAPVCFLISCSGLIPKLCH